MLLLMRMKQLLGSCVGVVDVVGGVDVALVHMPHPLNDPIGMSQLVSKRIIQMVKDDSVFDHH